jgi:Na+/H+ antiporter NhaC
MDQAGISSLLPIATTLAIALLARNVIAGLAVGVFVGVLMLSGAGPLQSAALMVTDHLVPQLMDGYNAAVLVLLVFIGGFVALMEDSGGGAAFARDVTRWLTSRVRVALAAWSGGIMIFFSDLGTPLIVGPVFRSLADQVGISRQKLAYIIDSTASPVAILIPFIGWGVYIMSLLQQQFELLRINESDFNAFVHAVGFQFYAWLAVLMVPALALLKLDFGAMAVAERGVAQQPVTTSAPAITAVDGHAHFIWLPLLVLGAILGWMLVPLGFPFAQVSGSEFRAALSVAYLGAAATLVVLMMVAGTRSLLSSLALYFEGMSRMMQVAVMLVLAWALSDVGAMLGTADYIAGIAATGVAGWSVPLMVFGFSAIISFATGSSWGTFAIMFPLALPAALATDANLFVVIGAVLSGGLFGDHSSPISETTILSATGADCDQYAHFRTQLPYALTNGALAALGFLLAGITGGQWVLLLVLALQIGLLFGLRAHLGGEPSGDTGGAGAGGDGTDSIS